MHQRRPTSEMVTASPRIVEDSDGLSITSSTACTSCQSASPAARSLRLLARPHTSATPFSHTSRDQWFFISVFRGRRLFARLNRSDPSVVKGCSVMLWPCLPFPSLFVFLLFFSLFFTLASLQAVGLRPLLPRQSRWSQRRCIQCDTPAYFVS